MRVAAIVVIYNPEIDQLLHNIESYADFVDEIIAVDNSDYVINYDFKFSNLIYIKEQCNCGIGKALNDGIKKAIDDGCDYALTMDQDSKFSNNILEIYKNYLDEKTVILSPNYVIDRKKLKKYKQETNDMYWTMTSGNLLNLNAYKKIGIFREDFFIDAVDYEYCLRARRNGFKVKQVNSALLLHNPGITKEKKVLFITLKYGYMSINRMYYQVRNLCVLVKEYRSLRALSVILMKFLKIVLLFDRKKKFFSCFNEGVKDFKQKRMGERKFNDR